jgi:hypothetical protein
MHVTNPRTKATEKGARRFWHQGPWHPSVRYPLLRHRMRKAGGESGRKNTDGRSTQPAILGETAQVLAPTWLRTSIKETNCWSLLDADGKQENVSTGSRTMHILESVLSGRQLSSFRLLSYGKVVVAFICFAERTAGAQIQHGEIVALGKPQWTEDQWTRRQFSV